jgi:hypothetical protein
MVFFSLAKAPREVTAKHRAQSPRGLMRTLKRRAASFEMQMSSTPAKRNSARGVAKAPDGATANILR